MSTVLVIAKEPVAGRVKTRLCPPLTPTEAATVAEAALADTLAAVAASGCDRRVLALDGRPGPWLPAGFEVVPQVSGDLGARLAAAWASVDGPTVQVGMDTPQLLPGHLHAAFDTLGAHDAAIGSALDGGWWGLAMRRWRDGAFDGVPMSSPSTGEAQRSRLRSLGLDVGELPALRDIDDVDDLTAVVADAPWTATASVARVLLGRAA